MLSLTALSAAALGVGLLLSLVRWEYGPIAARGAILGAVLLAVRSALRGYRGVQQEWGRRLGLYFGALCVGAAVVAARASTLHASDVGLDVVRQGFLLLFAWGMACAAARPAGRRALALWMTVVAVACSGIIVGAYLTFGGVSDLWRADLQAFKHAAFHDMGVATNPLSFAAVLGAIVGYPFWRFRPVVATGVLALVGAAIVLSGSRTTQGALVAAGCLTPVAIWAAKRKGFVQIAAVVVGAALLAGFGIVGGEMLARMDGAVVSNATTGRFDLWVLAWDGFMEHPVVGWGVGAHRHTDIAGLMPGYYAWGDDTLLLAMRSGGYHNAFLGLLVERGLLGAVPGFALVLFLGRLALAASSRGGYGFPKAILVFGFLLLVIRGFGEQAGWFGSANGPVDFLAYTVAALLVASSNPQGPRHAQEARMLQDALADGRKWVVPIAGEAPRGRS